MNKTPSGVGLKFGTKLMLLIGAALTSLVIIGAVAVIGLNRIAEDSRKLNEEGLAELTFIGDLQISIERMSSLVTTAPKETDNRILEAGRERFQNIASQLKGRIASMQEASAQADGDHAEELGQILEALQAYVDHSIHVYQMSGDGDWYGADKMMTEQTIPAKQQLDTLAADYISGVNRDSRAFVARMKAEIRRMTNLALAAAIGLIIAVGGGGLYIVTTSMRAINAIAGVTGRLAVGDMEVRIPGGERADEIGEMARSLEPVRALAFIASTLCRVSKAAPVRAGAPNPESSPDRSGANRAARDAMALFVKMTDPSRSTIVIAEEASSREDCARAALKPTALTCSRERAISPISSVRLPPGTRTSISPAARRPVTPAIALIARMLVETI